jgi:hypothetical protein
MSVDRIWHRWHNLTSLSSAASSWIEIGVVIDLVALRSTDVAVACGTIHLSCLLDLLVHSNFGSLGSRLFVAPWIGSILNLGIGSNSVKSKP